MKFDITGMSCSACAVRVEKAVRGVEGVEECNVSLPLNTLTVSGKASEGDIISAVEKAGYGCNPKGKKVNTKEKPEKSDALTRLVLGVIFLLPLMYLGMLHMAGLPIPEFLESYPVSNGIIQLILSGIILVINRRFFIGGVKGIINRSPNMDTLVSMGSGISFSYSLIELVRMPSLSTDTQTQTLHGLCFESAAMILVFVSIGKLLEEKAKKRTASSLVSLINMTPKTARLHTDDGDKIVSADTIKRDDLFAILTGDRIPCDGILTQGGISTDESALTGESIPIGKISGDKVYAGTLVTDGYAVCRATETENTSFAKVVALAENAASTKAPVQRLADKIASVFVPTVLVIAVITFVIHMLLGHGLTMSLSHGIAVLVISCPCSLGLATPAAVTVASGLAAKHGIFFKDAGTIENISKCDVLLTDKTGTLTIGSPRVDGIVSEIPEDELLGLASAVEQYSVHPLAKAVVQKYGKPFEKCDDFKNYPGAGVSGVVKGDKIFAGNFRFISKICNIPEKYKEENFGTCVYISKGDVFLGLISFSDTLRENASTVVKTLDDIGIQTVMLTGDNKKAAEKTAANCGIGSVRSGLSPKDKLAIIDEYKTAGKRTIMAGDGINDTPALCAADVGIAMSDGTDIASESADVTVHGFQDIAAAVILGKATMRIIRENLFWALGYNIIGIPLAAGVFSPFGINITPWFGALCMSISSIIVVSNALRLGKTKLYNSQNKEKKNMTVEMKIEGMMCCHCEARVKKTLEGIDGVESAIVSHENNNAIITLNKDIAFDVLKAAVENEGYKVL